MTVFTEIELWVIFLSVSLGVVSSYAVYKQANEAITRD